MRTPTLSRSSSKTLTPDQHVDAWSRSGLSARAYAAQHDLRPSSLYSCWRRLRERGEFAAPASRILPVHVVASIACEVLLPDGRALRFPESMAPARLRAFLDAMEHA